MKIQKIAHLFLLILLLSITAATETDTDTALDNSNKQPNTTIFSIGQTIKGISYKIDQGRSSHYLKVGGQITGKYLFLAFTTDKIYKHLNITLQVYSLQTQKYIQTCVSQQIDSCYIEYHKITQNESLLIIVQESNGQGYEYEIKTYWSDLEHIQIGKQVKFIFSKAEQKQIYHLDIKDKNFKEVKIIIKPVTRRYVFDKIKMYGSYGKDSQPSYQHYDFQSVYLWEDVQGIYLNKKDMKQMNLNLILYGQIQTVYTMKCELVTQNHHNIQLNTKIYQYLEHGSVYDYHLEFKKQGDVSYDEYLFRVAKFNGNFDIQLFSDKEKKNRLKTIEPSAYMGDIQYSFKKQDIGKQYPDGIFVQVSTSNKLTTYTMQFQGRIKANALKLHQHIYQFMQVKSRQLLYVKVAKYRQIDSKEEQPLLKVIFTFLKIRGSISIQFRKCLTDELVCTGQLYLNATQKISSQLRSIGQKDIHTLEFKEDFWNHINIVEQNAIVVIILTNLDKKQPSFAALEYNVGNRPQFLRQNKPIQSHVQKDERKIYKYTNIDPNIQKIRIFINKVSGKYTAYAYRQLETDQQADKQANNAHVVQGNIFQTSQDLIKKPIVIVIQGQQSSTFSISLQAVHKNNDEISSIVLSENVEFKTKIGPNKYQIFAVNPIIAYVLFKYKASGAVHVCQLNKNNTCDDKKLQLKNQGQILRDEFYDRTIFIKIRNPSSTKNIQVSTIFTSKNQKSCQIRKIGQFYREIVSQGSCLTTVISQIKDFEVTITREQMGNLSYGMFLCDKVLNFASKQSGQQRYQISKEELAKNCAGHNEKTFSFTASGIIQNPQSKSKQPLKNMHIKYLIQYKGDRIILPDGIAYHGKKIITQEGLGIFSYKLLNNINTSIQVTSQSKLYVLTKLVQKSQAQFTKIGINDHHFTSQKQSYYFSDYNLIKIDQEAFKKYPCTNCELIIGLYSKENIGQMTEFHIQVSQNFMMLEDGKPKKSFLTENSYAYYGFTVKQKGQILIQVTDNNQNCIQLYSSSEQYPDQKRSNEKSYDGQIFVTVDQTTAMYYITAKARKNCPYSIMASLASKDTNHLIKLTRGSLGYANLGQNQVKFFTFKHLSEKPFKILSLHNYGHVEFYLNKTTPQSLVKLFKQTTIKYLDFTYHSSHKNRLLLDKQSSQFCKDCTYILAVLAKKHTQSSIFLGDDQTKIPLSQDKVLNDILPKVNSITKAEMFGQEEGQIQIKVHSGKLEVSIMYKQQTLTKTFSKNTALQKFDFAFKAGQGGRRSFFARAIITFKALQNNTVYSSRIISKSTLEEEKQPGVKHYKMNSQLPNYAYLQKAIQKCYDGFLKRADEKIFISFSNNDRDLVKELAVIAKLNNNLTQITKQHTRNVIAIKYTDAVNFTNGAIPYSICLQSVKKSISVTIIQEEETNLLPQNTEMLVIKDQVYDVYPEGNMLLDVLQCRGTAKVTYGQNRKQLQNKIPKALEMMGMPKQPHAIKMSTGYSNVLFKVQGQLSLIRWLPINQQQQKGIGYILYQAGKLKYNNVFGQIQFLIDPIKNIKKTQTLVKNIKYNLYISNNQQQLQQASNCQLFLGSTVMSFHVAQQKIIDKSFKFIIMKNKLLQKYQKSQNLYVNVVADVIIQTPDKMEEEYRFIYNPQEIPSIVFTPNQIEKYDVTILIAAFAIIIVLILALACVFKTIVIPYLGKRNRALVQENNDNSKGQPQPQIKDDNLDPLPSTDRQTLNAQPQTDTKM